MQNGNAPGAILAAAQAGRVGEVLRLSREAQHLTQQQVGTLAQFSQTTISRIEREKYIPDIPSLRRLAEVLALPAVLLGLAEQTGDRRGAPLEEDPVKRREFLQAAAALAEAAAAHRQSDHSLAAIHSITAGQRRLDATTPSRELVGAVVAHLSMTARKHAGAVDDGQRRNLAAAVSEIAGYAAWLHWDMHDIGSARTYYATSIKAAHDTEDGTLHAYMLGSLATLAVYEGDAVEGLALLRSAAAEIGPRAPDIAMAWLSSLEAVAQADAGNARRTWEALDRADDAVERLAAENELPPWPWVFQFDHEKVARYRLTCAARLGRPEIAYGAARAAGVFMTDGHAKQRALLQLDLASAYLHDHEPEEAFSLASDAVSLGREVQSGRVIEAARKFRRQFSGAPSSPVVKDFDAQLYGTHY